MSQFSVVCFCAAMGFVTAGTLASFYQLVTTKRADFGLAKTGVAGVALMVLLSMFAGPFIVVSRVVTGLRTAEIKALPAAAGVVVAGMWSVCAGVFYLSLMIRI